MKASYGSPGIHDAQVVRFFDLDSIYVGSQVLAVQQDGKLLVQYFAQDSLHHFVRLNADGSIDGTFTETTFTPTDIIRDFPVVFDPVTQQTVQPPNGAWSASPALLDAYVQPDGRIILTGHFKTFGGSPARGVLRLESNGAIDTTFNVGGG